jgi:hypothetical protein
MGMRWMCELFTVRHEPISLGTLDHKWSENIREQESRDKDDEQIHKIFP